MLNTFYDFLIRHLKKKRKKSCFLKSEKKHKIRILEHCFHLYRGSGVRNGRGAPRLRCRVVWHTFYRALACASMQRAILFLFLSLSLTSWYCMETDSHTHRLVGPSNRGIILVFLSLVAITKFSGNTLSGSFNTRVQKNVFSTKVTVYLGNNRRYMPMDHYRKPIYSYRFR